MSATPPPASRRSPLLLGLVAVAAALALIVNALAGQGFPYNAPVEQIYCLGITIDLLALAITFGVGVVIARRGTMTMPPIGLVIAGLVLAVVGLLALALGGWQNLVLLAQAQPLRYMYTSVGPFFTGVLWVLGAAFCGFGIRRGGDRLTNRLAIAGLVVTAATVLISVGASIAYGLGLTA